MNSQVKAEVIEALGGIEDSITPMRQSLMQHEMRPFDIEPTYYEDLIANRSFLSNLAHAAKRGKSPAAEVADYQTFSRAELLNRTMHDPDYQSTHTRIVSASPYRAVVRQVEPQSPVTPEDRSLEDADEANDGPEIAPAAVNDEDDDFIRDEEAQDRMKMLGYDSNSLEAAEARKSYNSGDVNPRVGLARNTGGSQTF
jgi:hypothetical protein